MDDPSGAAPPLLYLPSASRELVELAIVRGSAVALPVHFHEEDQVSFVVSGRRRFRIGGGLVEVGPGQVAFIAAGTPHGSLDEPDGVVCLNAYLPAGGGPPEAHVEAMIRHWRATARGTVMGAAEVAGLSREGFSRAFRRTHGVAPSVVRSLLRLNQARALLRAGAPLAAAAAEAGFADQSHLGRCFRRAFGVTPGRYRAGWSHPFQTTSLS